MRAEHNEGTHQDQAQPLGESQRHGEGNGGLGAWKGFSTPGWVGGRPNPAQEDPGHPAVMLGQGLRVPGAVGKAPAAWSKGHTKQGEGLPALVGVTANRKQRESLVPTFAITLVPSHPNALERPGPCCPSAVGYGHNGQSHGEGWMGGGLCSMGCSGAALQGATH